MKWKYYRLTKQGVSKWVSGNNWVTRHDNNWHLCIIGVHGVRRPRDFVGTPKEARQFIEQLFI